MDKLKTFSWVSFPPESFNFEKRYYIVIKSLGNRMFVTFNHNFVSMIMHGFLKVFRPSSVLTQTFVFIPALRSISTRSRTKLSVCLELCENQKQISTEIGVKIVEHYTLAK